MMNTIIMKVCRICLENSIQCTYLDIFDDMNGEQYYFSDFIEAISHIKIKKSDDHLPKWLCEDCANSLKDILNFITTIQTTNEQLLGNVQAKDECNENLSDEIGDVDADTTETTIDEFLLTTEEYNKNESDENSIQIADIQLMENIVAYSLSINTTEEDEQFQQQQQYEEEEHILDDDNEQDEQDNQTDQNDELDQSDIKELSDIDSLDFADLNDTVSCHLCKRSLKRRNLHKHLALHEKKRAKVQQEQKTNRYLCAYCPRKFKAAQSLQQHERIHRHATDDIIYVCGDCNRQYSTQYQLDSHRKLAHKERDKICTICGNAFKLKNQLMNHMKLHLEKNIKCPHCDKKYARQFDLNVHLRSHTGELPYSCHLCEKRFAIKVRLTYHLQKHYGIKHRCKECSAEFNSRQKLKAHTFKHTGMPYRCELCDNRGFPTRNVFKRHLCRVHNTSMSDETLVEMFQRNTGKTIKIKQVTQSNVMEITDGFGDSDEISDMVNSQDKCIVDMDMKRSNVI